MQQPYQQNTFGSHSPLAFTVQVLERIFTLAAASVEVQKRLEETKQGKQGLDQECVWEREDEKGDPAEEIEGTQKGMRIKTNKQTTAYWRPTAKRRCYE